MTLFNEAVFTLGSTDRAHLEGDLLDYADGTGDTEPIMNLMLDVGGEALTVTFDGYHLREFRLAIQRAERWMKAERALKGRGHNEPS